MDQPFETVTLVFERGSMTGSEIQAILDEVLAELDDPASEVSRESAELKVSVDSLNVDEKPGVLPLAIAIALAIKFGGGAAAAGGALFFNQVIKPRIVKHKADGIGEQIEEDKNDPQA